MVFVNPVTIINYVFVVAITLISFYSDYVILTDFTIALLEDSGWYKGNYTALHELNQLPLEWGKGTYVEDLTALYVLLTCVCT